MDARFVLTEVSKLTTQVERLISDVRDQGEKIDAVRHQVSLVKGAMWVVGALVAFGTAIITLHEHISFH